MKVPSVKQIKKDNGVSKTDAKVLRKFMKAMRKERLTIDDAIRTAVLADMAVRNAYKKKQF